MIDAVAIEHADAASTTGTNIPMQGFYSTGGVVTFNDRVLDKDYLVVQEEGSAVLVAGGETAFFQKQLKVGEQVELGGALQPGKYLPVLAPLIIAEHGRYALPEPVTETLGAPVTANQCGKWSEFEGRGAYREFKRHHFRRRPERA